MLQPILVQTKLLAPKVPAQRCVCCRRELPTGSGQLVEFIGTLGPECIKKFGPLLWAIEQVNGFEALEEDEGTLKLAHHLLWDLRRAGVAVEVVDVKAGVKMLKVKGLSKKPAAALESWEQTQTRFEQRLQLAAAEREGGVACPSASVHDEESVLAPYIPSEPVHKWSITRFKGQLEFFTGRGLIDEANALTAAWRGGAA